MNTALPDSPPILNQWRNVYWVLLLIQFIIFLAFVFMTLHYHR
jgi:hypothetical protein